MWIRQGGGLSLGRGPGLKGSPAHAVGGHDVQHLGGLDAHQVVRVL